MKNTFNIFVTEYFWGGLDFLIQADTPLYFPSFFCPTNKVSGGRTKDKITRDKVFPKAQKVTPNEGFSLDMFSVSSLRCEVLGKHFADASHLEKSRHRYQS